MENMCRTCLRMPSNLLPLFDDGQLPDKIATISDIKVAPDDNLPSMICPECIININLSYNFRKVIKNSNIELCKRIEGLSKSLNSGNESEINNVETALTKARNEVKETETSLDVENVKIRDLDKEKTLQTNTKAVKDNRKTLQVRSKIGLKQKYDDEIKIYDCNICLFTCLSYNDLHAHRIKQHFPRGICNICGKSVSTYNLQRHVKNHSESPVKCPKCGKMLKNLQSLRSHDLRHNDSTLTCEICGRTFRFTSEYTKHRRKHLTNGQRTQKCHICGKVFIEKRSLSQHLRTHTGERPFPCQYCGKRFTSSNARKVHVRQHTNEKPYTCNYCSMAFPQKVSLRNHLKSKHLIV